MSDWTAPPLKLDEAEAVSTINPQLRTEQKQISTETQQLNENHEKLNEQHNEAVATQTVLQAMIYGYSDPTEIQEIIDGSNKFIQDQLAHGKSLETVEAIAAANLRKTNNEAKTDPQQANSYRMLMWIARERKTSGDIPTFTERAYIANNEALQRDKLPVEKVKEMATELRVRTKLAALTSEIRWKQSIIRDLMPSDPNHRQQAEYYINASQFPTNSNLTDAQIGALILQVRYAANTRRQLKGEIISQQQANESRSDVRKPNETTPPLTTGKLETIQPEKSLRVGDTIIEIGPMQVGAIPLSGKKDLGNEVIRNKHTNDVIVTGGQDATGARVYPRTSNVIATMVTVDGASFGDKVRTAIAAKESVKLGLVSAPDIRRNYDRASISDGISSSLLSMHKRVQEFQTQGKEDAAATAVMSVIYRSTGSTGKDAVYLEVGAVGDPNVLLLSRSRTGEMKLIKAVQPADRLEMTLRKAGVKSEGLSVAEAEQIRDAELAKKIAEVGNEYAVRKMYLESGISEYLGKGTLNDDSIRRFRVNLTAEAKTEDWEQVTVLTCSDNVGDKMDPTDIERLRTQYPDDEEFTKALIRLMGVQDQDDGSFNAITLNFREN